MRKVFLTDGQWRKTLASVRSLGRAGYRVLVGSERKLATSFTSRYCYKSIIYPSPSKNPEEFALFIMDFLKKEKPDVSIPMDDEAVLFFSKNIVDIGQYTRVPFAPYEILRNGMEKARTLKAARKIGIPMPATCIASAMDEIEIPAPFPLIVKPSRGSGSRGLKRVNNRDELAIAVQNILSSGTEAIIQEHIPRDGAGYGASILLNSKSEIRAAFVHKRLREYPIDGGPSTLRVSVKYPELAQMGIELLKYLKWYGAAMVEFKMDTRDGVPKLMEINPRLWGSLQLAISAGVDFPRMLVEMAIDGDVTKKMDYNENVFARWLLPGDILHFISNPKRFQLEPSFFKFLGKGLVYDIITIDDPFPALSRMFEMFIFLFDPEMRKIVFR